MTIFDIHLNYHSHTANDQPSWYLQASHDETCWGMATAWERRKYQSVIVVADNLLAEKTCWKVVRAMPDWKARK